MPDPRKCPGCKDGIQVPSDAKLDQSGVTYIPAVAWSCDKCQRIDTVPTGESWRPYLFGGPGLPADTVKP